MKRPTYIANCYFCWWFRQRKHAAAFHRLLALSKVTQYFPININEPMELEINTGVAVDGTPIPLFGSQYCCPILKGNEAKWRDFFCLRRRLQRGPSPAGGPFLAPPPRFARLPIHNPTYQRFYCPWNRVFKFRSIFVILVIICFTASCTTTGSGSMYK